MIRTVATPTPPTSQARRSLQRKRRSEVRKRTQGAQTRWRRASSIFTYWMGSRFVIENYRTGDILSAKPITARVLHLFGDWRRLEEVCRELPEFSRQSIRDGIRQLVKNGL